MEKYSAYRDPGTGIQPFLTPVPSPSSRSTLLLITSPARYLIGLIRLIVILVLAICYVLIVKVLFTILLVIPPAQRVASAVVSSAIIRVVLFFLGFIWIPTEIVSKKRGRNYQNENTWNPGPGDLIISNWASWVELLWLAYRFDPVFVLPVSESVAGLVEAPSASPISHTPGRRPARTSMPDSSSTSRNPTSQIPITGFHQVSLFRMLRESGRTPTHVATVDAKPRLLEEIRKTSKRPVIVFPECTTSNGRGLLRFADIFRQSLPVKGWNVFIMCVRYDPPTEVSPTVTHSIPSSLFNPIPHIFTLTSSLTLPALTIRLLAQSESPSSPTFLVSEVVGVSSVRDELAEASAVLISQLGKFKRMTMGWEDKARFLEFYRGKHSSK
ncbi:hypothetical protein GYMLUDRAFT_219320 [Collybiopsis luxurians FD-317 M1]|nr:hypothetical protein GYMLUDRAFT_219320 [Collybiopsis luxurians FD-317 M1]